MNLLDNMATRPMPQFEATTSYEFLYHSPVYELLSNPGKWVTWSSPLRDPFGQRPNAQPTFIVPWPDYLCSPHSRAELIEYLKSVTELLVQGYGGDHDVPMDITLPRPCLGRLHSTRSSITTFPFRIPESFGSIDFTALNIQHPSHAHLARIHGQPRPMSPSRLAQYAAAVMLPLPFAQDLARRDVIQEYQTSLVYLDYQLLTSLDACPNVIERDGHMLSVPKHYWVRWLTLHQNDMRAHIETDIALFGKEEVLRRVGTAQEIASTTGTR